jgi:catechol 2,3-dioxygenase-like lactoylglutathione lyase family enzyme/biotin operon repressor
LQRSLIAAMLASLFVTASTGMTAAQTGIKTFPYDHIHLNVPDPAAASAWYEKYFGGTRITEAPDRLMYGSTRLMFLRRASAEPSLNSSIDHIGFSVQDLDSKMSELQAAGVKIESPAREVEGLFKLAFIQDPWGTRIEIVQDRDLIGLHHLHLRAPEPEVMFTWLLQKLGGERTRLKGRLDGIRYSAPNYSTVWILIQQGSAAPSTGRAIDHIGWRSTDLKNDIEALRGKGATIQSEPRPLTLPNGPPINYAYVMGPNETRIEIVERPGLPPGK